MKLQERERMIQKIFIERISEHRKTTGYADELAAHLQNAFKEETRLAKKRKVQSLGFLILDDETFCGSDAGIAILGYLDALDA